MSLGSQKFLGVSDEPESAATMMTSVLSLAAAFDHFDKDKSAGLSMHELQPALEHLGIPATSEQAATILKQYDKYADDVIDVKEFASIVRDIKLMLTYDLDGDSELNATELLPALRSLGVSVSEHDVHQILARFDADGSGTIDLVELSSIVRTAQAFQRYDTDNSGAIDLDELRDALRKLGLRAGGDDVTTLFSRYDADGNGSIELHEFAVLVRDLQLYTSFDTECNGTISASELVRALKELGLKHPTTSMEAAAKPVLEAWDLDGDHQLNIAEFSQCAADVRVFVFSDADADGKLSVEELSTAMRRLGITDARAPEVLPKYNEQGASGFVSLPAFARLVRDLAPADLTKRFDVTVMAVADGSSKAKLTGHGVPTASRDSDMTA